MGEPRKPTRTLDYASLPAGGEPLWFGWAGVSVLLALLSAAVTMGIFLAPDRYGLTRWQINLVFRCMMLASVAALCAGLVAVVRRKGILAAVIGIVLALVNLGFIPAFIVH